MADDVLRLAGFVEGLNYRRQVTTSTGARPDFTFLLPQDRVLHMDVKFPFENWLKLVEAKDDAERQRTGAAFVRDVRGRIGEVAQRSYVAPTEGTLDFAVLFIPNEQVMAAALELEPALLDEALRKAVVLASPATLFAVLGVIRRTADSFRLAEASRDIVALLSGFREAWSGYLAESERVGKALDEAVAAFDRLRGLRVRRLEQRLAGLDRLAADGPTKLPPEPAG
jgi:DNA recombination protein RmuC